MRRGVSIGVGGGQAGEDHVGRMHGMSGVRGGVSGGRCVADGGEGRAHAGVGICSGSGGVVLWHSGVRDDVGTLEVRDSGGGVWAVGAACQ